MAAPEIHVSAIIAGLTCDGDAEYKETPMAEARKTVRATPKMASQTGLLNQGSAPSARTPRDFGYLSFPERYC